MKKAGRPAMVAGKVMASGAVCAAIAFGMGAATAMADTVAADESASATAAQESAAENGQTADQNGIVSCKIQVNSYVLWNGKAKKPAVHVFDGKTELTKGTDYSVAYKNNTKPGTATVKVTGLGKYASDDANLGSKTATFQILKFKTKTLTGSWGSYAAAGSVSGSDSESTSTYVKSLAAKITGDAAGSNNVISYSARKYGKGWTDWSSNGSKLSSSGDVQAIKIKLAGKVESYFDVYYRVYIRNTGWMGWAKNGSKAGLTGIKSSKLRVVGYQIKLVSKGEDAPGGIDMAHAESNDYEAYSKYVLYNRIKKTGSRTKYMISVDTTLCRMAVYKGKKKSWKQIRYWKCGCGRSVTPSSKGDFYLKGTTYRIDSGKISYYYFKRYKGGLGFHSVTTVIGTKTLSKPLSRQIGLNVSHGCIRLPLDQAEWVSKLPYYTHVCVRGLV